MSIPMLACAVRPEIYLVRHECAWLEPQTQGGVSSSQIIDVLEYGLREYHIDGIRINNAGLVPRCYVSHHTFSARDIRNRTPDPV
ncbi:uncharacterized protein METZ01_LOCUS462006, partial [marine metagenome]